MLRPALGITLLLCAVGAFADTVNDVSFLPGPLDSHTALTAVVRGSSPTSCTPFRATPSVDGSTLTLTLETLPHFPLACATVITGWSMSIFIGTLPPAKYEVVTMMGDTVLDRRNVVIADADPPFRINESVGPTNGTQGVVIELGELSAHYVSVEVTFDDLPATVSSLVGTHIQVVPPAHAAGPVTVKVNPFGLGTITAFGGFRYVDLNGAVDHAAFEAILIPLIFAGKGAFGSEWTTDLWVHNGNAFAVTQLGPFITRVCVVAPCPSPLEALSTVKYGTLGAQPFPQGVIMLVPRDSAPGLHFGLRVRDLTRQAEALGTEIPVIRERDLRAGAFSLPDIPTDARYRAKLRIYSLETMKGPVVVRFYRMTFPFTLAGTTTVEARAATRDTPAYAEVDLEQIFPKLAEPGPFRVEISPPAIGRPAYWAFISVTNNQTQHVTVVTPQ